MECRCCRYRWSLLEGGLPGSELPSPRRKLSAAEAKEIRESKEPLRVFHERYGLGMSVLARIRQGKTYRDVEECDDLACADCTHWHRGCGFGFPEAGGNFARECLHYEQR